MLKFNIVQNNLIIFARLVVMAMNLWKMESLVVKLEEMLSHLPKKPKKIEVKRLLIKRKSFEKLNYNLS
jgi:hypothetical protein